MPDRDWYVAGHLISAPDEQVAMAECFRLYNHLAHEAREWTTADTIERITSDSPVVSTLVDALIDRGNDEAAAWLLMNEDEAWGDFIGPMLDDIEGRVDHE